ncbi:hypothetical protein ABZ614_24105 [Streptomyces sp. NPDC013178]|uniref:hypothetical protein n=1 Tax=Streptomyces sp. NPDC013178 TaxID=3155118 RepID=UPI0033E0268E
MSEEEFDAFLRYLAEKYMRDVPVWRDEQGYIRSHLNRLQDADKVIKLLLSRYAGEETVEVDDELAEQAVRDTASGVHLQNRLAEHSGMMDILDEYFIDLSLRLRPDHLPQSEQDTLRALGFHEIADNLAAIMYEARLRAERPRITQRDLAVRKELQQLEERLRQAVDEPPRKRKWWSGLGDIVTGSALSVADIGMTIGVIATGTPIPPWVAIPSCTGGVAQIMKGIGVLRGE